MLKSNRSTILTWACIGTLFYCSMHSALKAQTEDASRPSETKPETHAPADVYSNGRKVKHKIIIEGKTYLMTIPDIPKTQKLLEGLRKDGTWEGKKWLGCTVFPPISKGLLLMSGKYIKPPYQFIRVGPCIFLNNKMVRYFPQWQYDRLDGVDADVTVNAIDGHVKSQLEELKENQINIVAGVLGSGRRIYQHDSIGFLTLETIRWAKLWLSDMSHEEKWKEYEKLRGKRAYVRLAEEHVKRLKTSDTNAFVDHVTKMVHSAMAERELERQRLEKQRKEKREAYLREQAKQAKKKPAWKRPGYYYCGADQEGNAIWIKETKYLDTTSSGVFITDWIYFMRVGSSYSPFSEEWPIKSPRSKHLWKIRPWRRDRFGSQDATSWSELSFRVCYGLGIDEFLDKKWKVMLYDTASVPLTESQKQRINKINDRDPGSIRVIPVFESRLVVVVPENSPLKSLSGPLLHDIYKAKENCALLKTQQYPELHLYYCLQDGPNRLNEPLQWFSRYPDVYLQGRPEYFPSNYPDGKARVNISIEGVPHGDFFQKIAKDRWSIGFVALSAQSIDDLKNTNLRILPVSADGKQPPVMPILKPVMQPEYPLVDRMSLFIWSDAPPWTMQVADHLVSPEFSEAVWRNGLITKTKSELVASQMRLNLAKKGQGKHIFTQGSDYANDLFLSLLTEYVSAKKVMQLKYVSIDSDVASVGAFVEGDGKRELLVLGDRPSMRAMEIHGEKWDSLGRDEDGKPDGTGPVEHVLAGRAVAVIVNPANKLASLSLAQIESIFGGDVKDWSLIGGTGLSSPAGPAGRDGAIPIRCYGLYGRNPAAELFANECLAAAELGRVERLKDTAAVLSAVSMEPGAIAFVDLAAIPASGQSVKILPIKFGHGEKAKNIAPTAENIRSAMYPLSQRYFLYVHPKASDTAKDYATFIATCGASEASPYADTVKAVMETYRKHGLIPLADAAIERMARDVQDARAKAAKKK